MRKFIFRKVILPIILLCVVAGIFFICNNTFIIEDSNVNTKMFEALPGASNQLWFDSTKTGPK